jgi:uncharacterized protein (TIGR03435 family)
MSSIDNVPRNSLFSAQCVSIWGLILGAYNLKSTYLLTNVPAWIRLTKYDVVAKSDSSTDEALAKLSDNDSYADKRQMLQALLAERFKLQIHAETRTSMIYELRTTARTAKLMTPTRDNVTTCNNHPTNRGRDIQANGCPFSILLGLLRNQLGTDVVDDTGLSGAYAYHLMFYPSSTDLDENEERYPPLADAVREQLGLDLKEAKGPVTFWVIDNFERPSPN